MNLLSKTFNTNDLKSQPSILLHHNVKLMKNDILREWIIQNTKRGFHLNEYPLESKLATTVAEEVFLTEAVDIIHASSNDKFEDILNLCEEVECKYGITFIIEDGFSIGDFVEYVALNGLLLSESYIGVGLCHFTKRNYRIRQATFNDLEILRSLESACWPPALEASTETLKSRIYKFPSGQLVLDVDNKIAGAVYSQLINNYEDIYGKNFKNVELLSKPNGIILQLLALNVFPTFQNKSYGDELLNFVLERARISSNIRTIVGVTRCRAYSKHTLSSYDDYIHAKNESGVYVDPVLNFHVSHGAKVIQTIPEYRPEDFENRGNGVLVKYDLDNSFSEEIPSRQMENSDQCTFDIIVDAIKFLIPDYIESNSNLTFLEIGLDSSDLLTLSQLLENKLGTVLPSSIFFKFPTPDALLLHLNSIRTSTNSLKEEILDSVKTQNEDKTIAVIGMSCRGPNGIQSTSDLWKVLRDGKDCITPILNERNELGNIDETSGGFLQGVSEFDSTFFNISPREATLMDPQQRILLETHWEACESAGLLPEKLKGTDTGVFVGVSSHDYEILGVKNRTESDDSFVATGSSNAVAAGRIAYYYGLNGPAMVIDTACSSSLVALHIGSQSLVNHESSLAFVSGVNLILTNETTERYKKAGMLSPSHKCFTFDERANGYVRSEGVGVLVLKRYADAQRDGDRILCKILGSAINQDGHSNGLTAPNLLAQEAVYKKALEHSNQTSNQIQYVEAHGTGTSLGDYVECESLSEVYGQGNRQSNLYIGSVKTNLGHTEAAAGILGTIKLILSLQNELIPASINYKTPNPHLLNLKGIEVVSKNIKWEKTKFIPRRGAVSSFGFSGTNCHTIFEEGPSYDHENNSKNMQVVSVSATTRSSLKQLLSKYVDFIQSSNNDILENLSFTSVSCRTQFKYRLAVTGNTLSEISEKLLNSEIKEPSDNNKWCMGFIGDEELNISHPLFLEQKKRCMDLIYTKEEKPSKQLIAFCSQFAMGKVLIELGGNPSFGFGYGTGRLAIAVLAGIITLEDALNILTSHANVKEIQTSRFPIIELPSCELSNKNQILNLQGTSLRKEEIAKSLQTLKCSTTLLNGQVLELESLGSTDDIFLKTLSHLCNCGIVKTLASLYSHLKRDKFLIPNFSTYAFDRQHYWIQIQNFEEKHKQIDEVETMKIWSNNVESIRKLPSKHSQNAIQDVIQEMISFLLQMEHCCFDVSAGFVSLGLDSMLLQELRQMIVEWLGQDIPRTSLFDFPSVQSLSEYVSKLILSSSPPQTPLIQMAEETVLNKTEKEHPSGVGVVGLACRFGSASSPEEFWDIVSRGEVCVGPIPKGRFDVEKYYNSKDAKSDGMYVKNGSFIKSIDMFDGNLFGITPKEIEVMDPQQRILLEIVWEALERSGISPSSVNGTKTGVYIGQTWNDYGNLLGHAQIEQNTSTPYICSGNSYATSSGRIAYTFGTLGPALTVDTACSSSLMAVHLAITALERGEIDMAIAGGANLLISHLPWINLCKAKMLNENGQSHTFDSRASGYARGEGVGIVILKRIPDAVNGNDKILAKLISAANQDGKTSGFTVPNGRAQAELIQEALSIASLKPNDIDLIEAHGTSTSLGDPIEVGSLEEVFKGRSKPLYLTSTKSNFNHSEAAAGICGLIKCILSLENKQIPPQANFNTLNPNMSSSFAKTFAIPNKLTPWTQCQNSSNNLRRAGVNSFGFSGTNVHVLVEEVKETHIPIQINETRSSHILTLSAKSQESLHQIINKYKEKLESLSESEVPNFLHTSNVARAHLTHRAVAVGNSKKEILEALVSSETKAVTPKTLAFYLNLSAAECLVLARCLYSVIPNFSSNFDWIISQTGILHIKECILGSSNEKMSNEDSALAEFIVQYSFVKMLESWGIEPEYIIGNANGEIAANVLSESLVISSALNKLKHQSTILQDLKSTKKHIKPIIRNPIWVCFGTNNTDADIIFNEINIANMWSNIMSLLGQLYLAGFNPCFNVVNKPFGFSKLQIPTYAFNRKRYWAPFLESQGISGLDEDISTTKIAQISDSYFYDETWSEIQALNNPLIKTANILLISRHPSLLDSYSKELQKIQQKYSTVLLQEGGDGCNFILDMFSSEQFEKLAKESNIDPSHIFLLHSGAEEAAEMNVIKSQKMDLASLIHTLQNLRNWPMLPSFVLVTSGAAPVPGTDLSTQSYTHSLWATLRSIGREDPTLQISSLDIDPASTLEENIGSIVRGVGNCSETQIALRNGKVFTPRLIQTTIPELKNELNFRSDRSYLVTGGLGGIGLRLAEWLVCCGVRNLVLTSRRPPDSETQLFLNHLKASCPTLRLCIILSDVSIREKVYELFNDINEMKLPPLDGIFHAAGTLSDATLINQSIENFEKTFAAKAWGAYWLHQASIEFNLNLNHFILFSSISVLIGPIGKSNYSAANAFLDSLAINRRAIGLPAQSIRWGAWGEAGMAAQDAAFGENNSGIRAFPIMQGLEALETIIESQLPLSIFCRFDWTKWQQQDCWDRKWLSQMDIPLPPIATVHFNSSIKSKFVEEFENSLTLNEKSKVVKNQISKLISEITGLPSNTMDENTKFADLGLDSLMFIDLQQGIQSDIGNLILLPTTLVFDYSTPRLLSEYLTKEINRTLKNNSNTENVCDVKKEFDENQTSSRNEDEDEDCIAVIGVGCKFPGNADTPDDFWKLLLDGNCTIEEVPKSRFDVNKFYSEDRGVSGRLYCRYGSFISDFDKFDSEFFGTNAKEASLMDPQQRLLLQVAYEAIEDACIPIESLQGSRTGTFVGISNNDYRELLLENKNHPSQEYYHVYTFTGNALSTAAGRISHTFNFQGPALSIDTACSSSLVAVHEAVQSLKNGECNLALACGVNVILSPDPTIQVSKANMLSSRLLRTFDAEADGFIRGEGVGVVILKRQKDAIAAGDRILALVRGSGINHDGQSTTLTSPNGRSQELLLNKVLNDSGISGDDVQFLETHGTGTRIGDPIEVSAIQNSKYNTVSRKYPLTLGAGKSLHGHLESAAGIASFIKVVLSLKNKIIPRNHNFKTLNPLINNENGKLNFPTKNSPWINHSKKPLLAGVSSFGMSGTNAHVILQEAPPVKEIKKEEGIHNFLLTLSAKTETALQSIQNSIVQLLDNGIDLADLCKTSQIGREHFRCRLAMTAATNEEMKQKLLVRQKSQGQYFQDLQNFTLIFTSEVKNANISKELYNSIEVYKQAIEDCQGIISRILPHFSLLNQPNINLEKIEQKLLNFSAKYAIGITFKHFINPSTLIGSGLGLLSAAAVSESITLEEALTFLSVDSGSKKIDLRETNTVILNGEGNKCISITSDDVFNSTFREVGNICKGLDKSFVGLVMDTLPKIYNFKQDEESLITQCVINSEYDLVLNLLSLLYIHGVNINFNPISNNGKKIRIPTYPFIKRRHWAKSIERDYTSTEKDVKIEKSPIIYEELEKELNDSGRESINGNPLSCILGFYSKRNLTENSVVEDELLQVCLQALEDASISSESLKNEKLTTLFNITNSDFLTECPPIADNILKKLELDGESYDTETSDSEIILEGIEKVLENENLCAVGTVKMEEEKILSIDVLILKSYEAAVRDGNKIIKIIHESDVDSFSLLDKDVCCSSVMDICDALMNNVAQFKCTETLTAVQPGESTKTSNRDEPQNIILPSCIEDKESVTNFENLLRNESSVSEPINLEVNQTQINKETAKDTIKELHLNSTKDEKLVFLFTGQGSQYIGMGKTLFETNQTFRENLEACDKILSNKLNGKSLIELIFKEENASLLNRTEFAQPCLFSLEYALGCFWLDQGVSPDLMIGHSVGENVAATLAGVMTLEESIDLIFHRARLMQSLPEGHGGMLAVKSSAENVKLMLNSTELSTTLQIAAINSPNQVVMSGPLAEIESFSTLLKSKGIRSTKLNVSHAFHSSLLNPVAQEFENIAREINYKKPKYPIISNLTGEIVEEYSHKYWVSHMLSTVNFVDSVKKAQELKGKIWLEIGPKSLLLPLVKQIINLKSSENGGIFVTSMYDSINNTESINKAMNQLLEAGINVKLNNE